MLRAFLAVWHDSPFSGSACVRAGIAVHMPRASKKKSLKGRRGQHTAQWHHFRSISSKIKRRTGYSMPRGHMFLVKVLGESNLPALHEASRRLARQEKESMKPVSMVVAGVGHDPSSCSAVIEGTPLDCSGISTQSLYDRLCELEAAKVALVQEEVRIFEECLRRGCIAEVAPPSDAFEESPACEDS